MTGCRIGKITPKPTNVHILDIITDQNIPADRVLNAAIVHRLDTAIVCGLDRDGNEYFASSVAGGPEALWLLQRCQKRLLEGMDE